MQFIMMMKGTENQLKYLAVAILLLVFSFVGCAHRNVANPSYSSMDLSFHSNQRTTSSSLDQAQLKRGEVEKNSQDENLDIFFEKEKEEETVQVADPLQLWNRAMFHFNDKLYFWALKPVARGYRAVVPTPARRGARNFLYNLATPVRIVSSLLQGKGRTASAELTRFLINSTVGILGLGNPAKRWPELNPSEEDLGQTLGTYGIGNGFYLVWPILGPSTLRDSVGMVGDWFLKPISYVEPTEAYLGVRAYEIVNDASFQIGDYESLKDAAIDPYVALRNAYIQNRKKKVEE
jgi:phospholipid-binding lipoprotein MlaA